eukprot:scaffold52654_cov75-Phaeocystis_antarctica.AAC.1
MDPEKSWTGLCAEEVEPITVRVDQDRTHWRRNCEPCRVKWLHLWQAQDEQLRLSARCVRERGEQVRAG